MSGMIDRVAVAISGAPFPSAASRKKAIAAIEAMREPSMAMIEKGQDAIEESIEFTQDSYERYPVFSMSPMARSGWDAMISQALKSD